MVPYICIQYNIMHALVFRRTVVKQNSENRNIADLGIFTNE